MSQNNREFELGGVNHLALVCSDMQRTVEFNIVSAVGSMNHVAFSVPADRFLEYYARMREKGVEVSPILDHDDSPFGVARELHPGVFVRSFYFRDPDGILLEFACWTRAFTAADVAHQPRTAADRTIPSGVG